MAFVTRRLARFVNSPYTDLVLIPNATTGTSTVLRSFDLQPGDQVLMLNVTYGEFAALIHGHCSFNGLRNLIPVPFSHSFGGS